MGDVALAWGSGFADLAIVDDDIASDEGLRTAALLSLFTDRRAEADDPLPGEDGDRRGWWADEFATVEGDRIGSRLWLLDREPLRGDIVRRAKELADEAVAWFVEDKVCSAVDVVVTAGPVVPGGPLGLIYDITFHRFVGDPIAFRFAPAWDAEMAADGGADLLPGSIPVEAPDTLITLLSASSTTAAPDVDDGDLGVARPDRVTYDNALLLVESATGADVMTVVVELFAWHPVRERWYTCGTFNAGAAIGEGSLTDQISFTEEIGGLRRFTRFYARIVASTGDTYNVSLDFVPSSAAP